MQSERNRFEHSVAVSGVGGVYPQEFPYSPDEKFPEYPGDIAFTLNPVYRAVRQNFELLGYDRARFGSSEWNPLGHIVRPGNRVFIKPNLCSHEYGRKKEKRQGDIFSIITHPSVVRAVADYVAIALKGEGEIIIGDNPTIDASFSGLMATTHLDKFPEYYQRVFGIKCSVLDLRELWCDDLKNYGNKTLMKKLPGDPLGETIVNLGEKSFFYGLNPLLFRGVFTNRWETIRHHFGRRQEYAVANSIYQADVYVSVPKLKTHHKAGATLNIKGLVGICTKKNYLVHWRIGFPSWGGDEYPEPEHALEHLRLALGHLATAITPEHLAARIATKYKDHPAAKLFEVGPYRGSWEGNDTCWRMAADLYLALMSRTRKTLSVIDGVVAGDGDGPFCVNRREAGTIISGENLVFTDLVAVRMMDFDIAKIHYLTGLLGMLGLELDSLCVLSKDYDTSDFFDRKRSFLKFAPPTAWTHLSLDSA